MITTTYNLNLGLSFSLKYFICAKPIQSMSINHKSYSESFSLFKCNTKDPILMQINLIVKNTLKKHTKSILQVS